MANLVTEHTARATGVPAGPEMSATAQRDAIEIQHVLGEIESIIRGISDPGLREVLSRQISGIQQQLTAGIRPGDIAGLRQLADSVRQQAITVVTSDSVIRSTQLAAQNAVLSAAAMDRIQISSQRITNANLAEFARTMIDPNHEMDAETRQQQTRTFEIALRSPEGQAALAIRNSHSDETRKLTSTLIEETREKLDKLAENEQDPNRKRMLQSALTSEVYSSANGIAFVLKLELGEIADTRAGWQEINRLQEEKTLAAKPFAHTISATLDRDDKAILATIGQPDGSGLDIQSILKANAALTKEERKEAWEERRHFKEAGRSEDDLPEGTRRNLAVMRAAGSIMPLAALTQYNELAQQVSKYEELGQKLSAYQSERIAERDTIENTGLSQEMRRAALSQLYARENPELYSLASTNPDRYNLMLDATLETIGNHKEAFGVADDSHLGDYVKEVKSNMRSLTTSQKAVASAVAKTEVASHAINSGSNAIARRDSVGIEAAAHKVGNGVSHTLSQVGIDKGTAHEAGTATSTFAAGAGHILAGNAKAARTSADAVERGTQRTLTHHGLAAKDAHLVAEVAGAVTRNVGVSAAHAVETYRDGAEKAVEAVRNLRFTFSIDGTIKKNLAVLEKGDWDDFAYHAKNGKTLNLFDRNGDNHLTLEEIKRGLQDAGVKLDSKYDTNKDGNLDQKELLQSMKNAVRRSSASFSRD